MGTTAVVPATATLDGLLNCKAQIVTAGYTVYLHFVSRLSGGGERTALRADVENLSVTLETLYLRRSVSEDCVDRTGEAVQR